MEALRSMRIFSLAAAFALATAACADVTAPVGISDTKAAEARGGSTLLAGQTTVYVVHGINGTDLGADESLPVDVSVNGACALTGFRFREMVGPITLPAAATDIRVHLRDGAGPCGGTVAIDAAGVPLPANQNVSIVAHLTNGGAPTASVFVNELTRVPVRTWVSPRHTANFGEVDILVNGAVAFGGVPNGTQGTAALRPGLYTFAINIAGTDITAWQATTPIRPFRFYAFYAVGTPANGTFEVLTQVIPVPQGR
jgi:hypothetical protein